MPQTRSMQISYTVHQPIEIEPGVTVPAGHYVGRTSETAFSNVAEGTKWTDPRYLLEFDEEQLAEMGSKALNTISIEYDVTKYVRSGQMSAS